MSGSKIWTRREIDRARTEFFDTRVTGRPEIWQAIRAALEVMWKGGEAGEEDGGLGTAQMILNAAEITLPEGDMAIRGCFDSSGVHYPVPEHIISDPANLLDDAAAPAGTGKIDDEDDAAEESEVDEEALSRREIKGKAKAKDMIAVKARFQHGINGDIVFRIGKNDTVRLLVREITRKLEVCLPKLLHHSILIQTIRSLHPSGLRSITWANFSKRTFHYQRRVGWKVTLLMHGCLN